jgi:TPR repeat protein
MAGLGAAYALGLGVPADPAAAADWHRKAANEGVPGSMFNLAMAYNLGLGLPRDPVKSFQWLVKAADLGFPGAWRALGEFFMQGLEPEPDPAKALEPAFPTFRMKPAVRGRAPSCPTPNANGVEDKR